MQLIYLGTFFLCFFLAGCERVPDEMEDIDKIVLSEEGDSAEWSLPEDRAVASGELSPSEEAN